MSWGARAVSLPLFALGRLDGATVREERVTAQVAAVLARIEPEAVQELLARWADRADIRGWTAPPGLSLRCEVVRARVDTPSRSRRLDLAWTLGDAVWFAIEVKVSQRSWLLGGPEATKFRGYAEAIRKETPTGACLLALTPHPLPRHEISPAKAVLPAGALRWRGFTEVLTEVATRTDDGLAPRWPVAAVLLTELVHLLGPGGLNLSFHFDEADLDTMTDYAAGLDAFIRVQKSLVSLEKEIAREFATLGLTYDEDASFDDVVFRIRSPFWAFDPAEPESCAEGFVVGLQLHLDVPAVLCFLGFWGEAHSEASLAALKDGGLPLAWWPADTERPQLGVPPDEWIALVREAGDSDWWGTATVRPLVEVLPNGIATDAPSALADWVAQELRAVGPRLVQADVWPTIAAWPAAWRSAQLRAHPEFGECAACPTERDPALPCADGQALGWGPVACQAHLVRPFVDDREQLRLKLPAASGTWKDAPKSTGLYVRKGELHCCGVELPALGKKQSLTCPTCGKKHLRATLQAASRA